MGITHQDIVDRIADLASQQFDAWKAEQARIAKERESLQELCGGLGHIFGEPKPFALNPASDAFGGRRCVFCEKREKG